MMRLEPSMLRSSCWLLLPWILLASAPAPGLITRAFLETPGDVGDVEVVGDLAFVADGVAGIRVLDVSNASAPREIGFLDTPGLAVDVDVVGDRAYVADGVGGVRRLDVESAPLLREDGFLATDRPAIAIAVGDRYACVALGEEGLLVVDVSGPTLVAEATFQAGASINDVQMDGDIAFVADDDDLRVIDLSPLSAKSEPVQIGFLSISGGAISELQRSGSTLWATGDGLVAVDVSDPTHPVRIGFGGPDDWLDGVAISGSLAFVTGRSGFHVLDLTTRPFTPISSIGPVRPRGVTVSGGLAYVHDAVGLRVIDVSHPGFPRTLGTAWVGEAEDLEVEGSLAWIAAGELHVLDLSDPLAPVEIAAHDEWRAQDLELVGDVAYVAGFRELHVIDVSSPVAPVELASLPLEARRVAVIGSRMYAVTGEPALHVIDVGTPSAPAVLGSLPLPGLSLGLDVVGLHVYVAAGDAGLRIIDVSDPAGPVEVGFHATPGFARHVEVVGPLAYVGYVGRNVDGIRIVDVSDPKSPADVNGSRCCASGLEVLGRFGYSGGPTVIDVSGAPSLLEVLQLPDLLHRVEPTGRLLHGVDFDGEFRTLDLGPEYVPEPGATLLAALAGSTVAWLARRRRRRSPPIARGTCQRSSAVNTTGIFAIPRTKGESV
jgi:hypothetical protein